ncbi:MAG: aldehyde ferredoxin oxidoreductase N-terminal domain-containing protein [Candidatus Natronoplasma sp.]
MKILDIDLSSYDYSIEEKEDLKKWLGGSGLATQLMKEKMEDKECDPLEKENVIVFASGPFNSAYPVASKCVAMFKSPLTGNLGESHAGGRVGTSISNAGHDALVLRGKSDNPIYIVVDNDEVYFRDASAIWGIGNSLIVGRILAEREKKRGRRAVLRIGGAGEKMVSYADVTAETFRHFGRLGLGAVFGSKKLKGLVIIGDRSEEVGEAKKYRKMYDEIYERAVESDAMDKYHLLGTAVNVASLDEIGALPTKNLQRTSSDSVSELSGENLAESIGRRVACNHCPIACIHIANLREPYRNQPYFYKTYMISYDYELIYALGSMLDLRSKEDFLRMIHKVEIHGLDAMSTGVSLAWATEALEKGLISTEETLEPLEFGERGPYLKAVDHLIGRPNEFYEHLGKGVEHASDVYGGKGFALAFGGNEMPGYHTGPAAIIGRSIAQRHSHLDNAGYSTDQKIEEIPPPEELVDQLVEEEQWRQVLSSLVVCYFARGVYDDDLIVRALEPLGIKIKEKELRDLGEEIYFEKLGLKKELGFDMDDLRIPERVYETESARGPVNEEYVQKALDHFKSVMEGQ